MTDGLHWSVYDCYARVPNPRRRFIDVDLTDAETAAAELAVLSPDGVIGGALDQWAGQRLAWQELIRVLEEEGAQLAQKIADELGTVDAELVMRTLREAARALAKHGRGRGSNEEWNSFFEKCSARAAAEAVRKALLAAGAEERHLKGYWGFKVGGRKFCELRPRKGYVLMDLRVPAAVVKDLGLPVRDVTGVGDWPTGRTRVAIQPETDPAKLIEAARRAMDHVAQGGR
ncbi:MAG: hypothetical protein H5T86_06730 [Armatimonadetes bacterium]|nr:hypothetical protein [Armatimonadota bacterium]